MPRGRQVDITIYKIIPYIYLGAAASVAAASTFRRLTATCGLVLLPQVPTRTACITIVAVSTRPPPLNVRAAIQSAVSPRALNDQKQIPF